MKRVDPSDNNDVPKRLPGALALFSQEFYQGCKKTNGVVEHYPRWMSTQGKAEWEKLTDAEKQPHHFHPPVLGGTFDRCPAFQCWSCVDIGIM